MHEIGKVLHFYGRLGVAVIELKENIQLGDKIHVLGATSDFTQEVDSMQIDNEKVHYARSGQQVGLSVIDYARTNDVVYKLQ